MITHPEALELLQLNSGNIADLFVRNYFGMSFVDRDTELSRRMAAELTREQIYAYVNSLTEPYNRRSRILFHALSVTLWKDRALKQIGYFSDALSAKCMTLTVTFGTKAAPPEQQVKLGYESSREDQSRWCDWINHPYSYYIPPVLTEMDLPPCVDGFNLLELTEEEERQLNLELSPGYDNLKDRQAKRRTEQQESFKQIVKSCNNIDEQSESTTLPESPSVQLESLPLEPQSSLAPEYTQPPQYIIDASAPAIESGSTQAYGVDVTTTAAAAVGCCTMLALSFMFFKSCFSPKSSGKTANTSADVSSVTNSHAKKNQ